MAFLEAGMGSSGMLSALRRCW